MATRNQAHPSEIDACIENCTRCHAICVETVAHCLAMGGPHAAPAHIRLLEDCAQICATSADFMLRGSDMHSFTCGACAEVCARCADECDRLADDEMMRECAEVCRQCAESCRRMSQEA